MAIIYGDICSSACDDKALDKFNHSVLQHLPHLWNLYLSGYVCYVAV